MSNDFDRLISEYLDEALSAEEQQQLEDWIKADPKNARRFAKAAMLHDRLHFAINDAVETTEQAPLQSVTPAPAPQPAQYLWIRERLLPLAAAIILLGIIVYQIVPTTSWRDGTDPNQGTFATLAQAWEVKYQSPTELVLGERLSSGQIELASGLIRLQFDSGVEVTLEGPASYHLKNGSETELSSGRLTAQVPPEAEGFRVITPTADVTDLGTAFGVELNQDGSSRVTVFEGEVIVSSPGSESATSVTEGKALLVNTDNISSPTEYDVTTFERHWPIASGIRSSTGAFHLIPHWRSLRRARSDTQIFVRLEPYIGTLNKALPTNISKPGNYRLRRQLTPRILPTGQAIRSYILHYQPQEILSPEEARRLVGKITFDRPILGLITGHEELKASAQRFSHRSAGEQQPRRQLNFNSGPAGDIVELSSDRRTLSLDLASPMFSSDLIRVIVDAGTPLL